MGKSYYNFLPAFHVPNIYGKVVPLRHPMVKPYPLELHRLTLARSPILLM